MENEKKKTYRIDLSTAPVAKTLGSYLFQSNVSTSDSWTGMVLTDCADRISQTFKVRSPDTEAILCADRGSHTALIS